MILQLIFFKWATYEDFGDVMKASSTAMYSIMCSPNQDYNLDSIRWEVVVLLLIMA